MILYVHYSSNDISVFVCSDATSMGCHGNTDWPRFSEGDMAAGGGRSLVPSHHPEPR